MLMKSQVFIRDVVATLGSQQCEWYGFLHNIWIFHRTENNCTVVFQDQKDEILPFSLNYSIVGMDFRLHSKNQLFSGTQVYHYS